METEYYELSICDNDLKYNNQYQLQQQTTHYFTLVYTTCVNSTSSTKLKYILYNKTFVFFGQKNYPF